MDCYLNAWNCTSVTSLSCAVVGYAASHMTSISSLTVIRARNTTTSVAWTHHSHACQRKPNSWDGTYACFLSSRLNKILLTLRAGCMLDTDTYNVFYIRYSLYSYTGNVQSATVHKAKTRTPKKEWTPMHLENCENRIKSNFQPNSPLLPKSRERLA